MSITGQELCLREFELPVRIGCLPKEQKWPQPVEYSCRIVFPELQPGESNDELSEVISYVDICDLIREVGTSRHFNLVENLARETFTRLRNIVPTEARLELSVNKKFPPVDGLRGGATYRISD